jgi:protein-tyrosine kinase
VDRITRALQLASRHEMLFDTRGRAGPELTALARQMQVSWDIMRRNRLIADMPDHPAADAYRVLRARVLNMLRHDGWKVVGITSPVAQEGKTLTAANLAMSMAREPDTSVVLLDADLRRPGVLRCFGLETERGFADYLASDLALEQVLIAPGIERLFLLSGSTAAAGGSELLGSKKMVNLIDDLRGRADLGCVIVDMPPVLLGDDVILLSPYLDVVLLVVDDGRTRSDELSRSMELLERVKVVGTVLNRAR